jgi:peptidoglycan/LPS O-acetylase OafA/YrhL
MPGGPPIGTASTAALHPPKTATLGTNSTAFLDLLRGLAANLVLIGHAADVFKTGSHVPAGNIGVGIFFILSGFLILQSSLARLQRPGPYFAPYMIDRFARIFTAYIPVLILVAAVNAIVDLGRWGQEGTSTGPAAFLGNLLMLQDYPVFQAIHRLVGDWFYVRPYNTAEPFWTIPIEFWIYVVFGLAFFGLGVRERLRWLPSALLALVALPVVIWNAAAGGGNGLSLVWLVGAVGAYVWVGAWHRSAYKLQIGATVFLAAGICLLGRGLKTGWNFQDLAMVLCEAMLVITSVSMVDGLRTLPGAIRGACAFVASYSYSLYLVHNTVLVVVRHYLLGVLGQAALPVALVAAHAVAFVLYILFERHYRQVGAWLKRRLPGSAGGRLVVESASARPGSPEFSEMRHGDAGYGGFIGPPRRSGW